MLDGYEALDGNETMEYVNANFIQGKTSDSILLNGNCEIIASILQQIDHWVRGRLRGTKAVDLHEQLKTFVTNIDELAK